MPQSNEEIVRETANDVEPAELTSEEKRSLGLPEENEVEEKVENEVEEKVEEKEVVEEVVEEKVKPKTDVIQDVLKDRKRESEPKKELSTEESIKSEVETKYRLENLELKLAYKTATADMSDEEAEIVGKDLVNQINNGKLDALINKGMSIEDAVNDTIDSAVGRNIKSITDIRVKQERARLDARKKIEEVSTFKQKTGDGTPVDKIKSLEAEIMKGDNIDAEMAKIEEESEEITR